MELRKEAHVANLIHSSLDPIIHNNTLKKGKKKKKQYAYFNGVKKSLSKKNVDKAKMLECLETKKNGRKIEN